MGRDGHSAASAGVSTFVLRLALLCALVGGLAWIVSGVLYLGSGSERLLLWVGGVLLTVAMFVIGLLMVKGDVLTLRLFVAVALPVLVWGVFAILREATGDDRLLDAVFGVVVGLGSAAVLARRSRATRTTL